MSENIKAFPSNESEALAFLYVQSLDLSGLTPTQIYDKYRNAYEEIHKHKIDKSSKTTIINSPV